MLRGKDGLTAAVFAKGREEIRKVKGDYFSCSPEKEGKIHLSDFLFLSNCVIEVAIVLIFSVATGTICVD